MRPLLHINVCVLVFSIPKRKVNEVNIYFPLSVNAWRQNSNESDDEESTRRRNGAKESERWKKKV